VSYTIEDTIELAAHRANIEKYGADPVINVLYLDHDPTLAAQYHCDVHVSRMMLDAAQLLSTAWLMTNPELTSFDFVHTDPVFPYAGGRSDLGLMPGVCRYLAGQRIYGRTEQNSSSALWARESRANYEWLWRLATELVEEYRFRFERPVGRLAAILATLEVAPPGLPDAPRSEPEPDMPEELKISVDGFYDAVASYRNYYVTAKTQILRWGRRGAPYWITKSDGQFRLKEAA